jgi:transposase InsO family protein
MKTNRGLTLDRMMKLGRVSRSGFYRFQDAEPSPDGDMDLRDAIQRIAVEWPSYGRPRITAELRRRGWRVNPKRVYRLMREDNLLCVRRRKFVVTTDSNHGRRVYPNLARNMVLTATDQLWRADITYIRLRDEFVFLAVILDAYSRRVIGWALDRTLEDELPLAALRMALSRRTVQPGLVHHSDRGCQYASNDYTDLIESAPDRDQHVAQGESLGQRGLRVVHENAEVRGGPAQRVPGLSRGARFDPPVPGENLQSKTAALGARLSAAG